MLLVEILCKPYFFRNEGIEVRLVKRREYDEETVRWADAVIAAGGNSFAEVEMLEYEYAL